MAIKGFQPTSLIDYPDKICSVIFISKCNFRCGYCHNKDLVLDNVHGACKASEHLSEMWNISEHDHESLIHDIAHCKTIRTFQTTKQHMESANEPCTDIPNENKQNNNLLPTISEEKVLSHLEKRKNLVDAVVITGGEPTLYKELPELIKKIKQLGLLIKIDTNGSNPELLKQLIDLNLVDYIAMDVKAPLIKDKYDKVTNIDTDIDKIKQSIEIIKKTNIDHEFRTTVVPSLLSTEDILNIAKTLVGGKKFVIQQFVKHTELLDPAFNNQPAYSDKELEDIKKKCNEYIKTEVR